MLARMASAIRSAVTRAKVTAAVIGPRTLVQVTGLSNEVKNTVELLLPPGYSARPIAGADVVVFQVMGSRDHLVALGGDTAGADAIADLAPGEIGLRNHTAGTQIVLRNTGIIEITGTLHVTGQIVGGFGTADQVTLLGHDHTVNGVQTGTGTVTSAAPTAGT